MVSGWVERGTWKLGHMCLPRSLSRNWLNNTVFSFFRLPAISDICYCSVKYIFQAQTLQWHIYYCNAMLLHCKAVHFLLTEDGTVSISIPLDCWELIGIYWSARSLKTKQPIKHWNVSYLMGLRFASLFSNHNGPRNQSEMNRGPGAGILLAFLNRE